jgi:hypothetical protein
MMKMLLLMMMMMMMKMLLLHNLSKRHNRNDCIVDFH